MSTENMDKTSIVWSFLTKNQGSDGIVRLSRREIADAVGLESTSTVAYHLKRLEGWGYIETYRGVQRVITVHVGLYIANT